ncbi:uncharacterized protein LOC133871525 [Alnus glutinosa]|uniref:uncharacterized protein LOC133871525 n=1 Tax=Alnus glutinosa TaxID=3517 RepID=UPI002D770F58|nr:uncharacterized protein LOC133871525 [Alnus glutinosa]
MWSSYYGTLVLGPMNVDRIRVAQEDDLELQDLRDKARQGEADGFYLTEGGTLKTSSGKIVIPSDAELRRDILDELVKAKHQKLARLLKPLEVPMWKWDQITIDFVVDLPKAPSGQDAIWVIVDKLTKSTHLLPIKITDLMEKLPDLYVQEIVRLHGVPISIVSDHDPRFTSSFKATIGMAPYEALYNLYGCKCRSPLYWDEVSERQLLGLELVQVSPMWNVCRFGNKGKLSPRYVGPFKVLKQVSSLANKIEMPPNLAGVHDVFHVSQLQKCIHDQPQVINHEPLDIQPNLTYEELPVEILYRKEQQLRTKTIPLVKVLWGNHGPEEASWVLEQQMRDRYPHLFE